jgi:glucokinase
MKSVATQETTNPQSGYRVGVDIGGTKIKAILLNRQNEIIEDSLLATPKDSLNHLIIMIKAVVEPLIERATKDGQKIDSLGIGIAGVLDETHTKVFMAPNLEIINDVKILDKLEKDLDWTWPMLMDNDANCFTRGEALMGAGEKMDNVYGITIGTGIGGGWWFNGNIYEGAHGAANEPGEMLLDFNNKLTLEQAYQKLTQNNTRILAQEAYEGDELAEKSFHELGSYLGRALANIVNLLDPSIIVVGGGASEASDLFLDEARKVMIEHVTSPEAAKTKISRAKLGDNAGAIGAALLFQ